MRKFGVVVMVILFMAFFFSGTMLFSRGSKEPAEEIAGTTDITIGHGTFWTGPFAFVGPPFAAAL
jgi:hypothetical protein